MAVAIAAFAAATYAAAAHGCDSFRKRWAYMLGVGDYLWRLVPANPILLRVVEAGGKRRRDLFVRCGYLGLLIVVVLFSLVSSGGTVGGGSLSALAAVSATIFMQMSYLQLGLVAL